MCDPALLPLFSAFTRDAIRTSAVASVAQPLPANETVTHAEVHAQQVRDAAVEARAELDGIARRLGFEDVQPLDEPL